jgi:hypothetical protein
MGYAQSSKRVLQTENIYRLYMLDYLGTNINLLKVYLPRRMTYWRRIKVAKYGFKLSALRVVHHGDNLDTSKSLYSLTDPST